MLIIDGYLSCYLGHKYFYMEDEFREAMVDAYINNGVLVRAERDVSSGKKYYCSYDFQNKCWEDEFNMEELKANDKSIS